MQPARVLFRAGTKVRTRGKSISGSQREIFSRGSIKLINLNARPRLRENGEALRMPNGLIVPGIQSAEVIARLEADSRIRICLSPRIRSFRCFGRDALLN